MAEALGRVADPAALDALTGPRARLTITVPCAWLEEAAELEITAPRLLACDRCDAGGCDSCQRSGALRGPETETARRLTLRLPGGLERGALVRLAAPFDDSAIEQLLVEVSAGDEASAGVRRLLPPKSLAPPAPQAQWLAAALLVLLAAAVIVALAW